MSKTEHFGLDFETFANLIDNLHDEIIIYDNNYRMLYVNKACERHYGFSRQELIDMPFWDVVAKHKAWNRPMLPLIYEKKCQAKQVQQTYLGLEVLTIGTPVLDEYNEVEHVLLNVRDNYHESRILSPEELLCEDQASSESPPENFIYRSPGMEQAITNAKKVADVTAPCLLMGESGCGKSLLANFIHKKSKRADKPFVTVNCAAIPHELFESELFGHVEGAFSGATKARSGLFAKAKGGTLFLDEISELPLPMQAKLLYAVQELEYRPVGSSETLKADVRILAASNRNLDLMVENSAFRQDLYFRLNVFDIVIPPLRERPEDLIPLIHLFLNRYGKQHGKGKQLASDAQKLLCQYTWPGNVRELAHLIERLIVTVEGEMITVDHLPPSIYETQGYPTSLLNLSESLDETIEAVERRLILDAYQQHGTSRKVAAALNISQSRASRLIRKYTSDAKP
ncbi:sigma-54 interaction domain-containing protein [Halodesulfovibrio marinisediminis]|uniref:HTH-type transcriptional regulatory protein TyrR n=1 Tax=Halodesulfovibrio marinisediminis DSM 17456 TaxID=1121457 RepID=A0A1N6IA98_9BACT|nr:sigma 54-interacting transcriptional regulator [Halodesulfovibrio marinisediminis]SIO28905.1 PAS domain S-box-containing protein [Halodesulfovibrio marinisediminis DSM 17456]